MLTSRSKILAIALSLILFRGQELYTMGISHHAMLAVCNKASGIACFLEYITSPSTTIDPTSVATRAVSNATRAFLGLGSAAAGIKFAFSGLKDVDDALCNPPSERTEKLLGKGSSKLLAGAAFAYIGVCAALYPEEWCKR